MNIRSLTVPLVALLAVLMPGSASAAAADEEQLWALLASGGQVVLMRHAVTTPGVGDPPGMRIDDCSTQRNLTDEGRRHARAIGEAIRKRGVQFDRVLSSPMCRCLETARLAFGRVDAPEAVGNPRGGGTDMPKQVRDMRAIASEKRRGNVVLVSHGTTIAAVTSVYAEPGDMIIVTPQGGGAFEYRGKLSAAAP